MSCTVWLSTPAERWARFQASQREQAIAQVCAMQELVMECVHPGQFQVLPPSPEDIETKAYVLGVHWRR